MSGVRFRTVELSEPAHEVDGLRFVTVHSPALGRRADVTVYAARGETPSGGLPLVLLLHGVYGSHWAWAFKAGAHRVLQNLVDDGRVRPMVLAMPSDGLWCGGAGYVPRPEENSEAWIVEEVPVAAKLAVPGAGAGGIAVAGLSMGGYGALRLAGLYRERFVAAVGMSSITHLDQMPFFVAEGLDQYPVPEEDRAVADVLSRAGAPLPRIRFDCGRDDPLFQANQALHAALDAAGVDHVYEEFDGTHEWPYWATHLVDALLFVEASLP